MVLGFFHEHVGTISLTWAELNPQFCSSEARRAQSGTRLPNCDVRAKACYLNKKTRCTQNWFPRRTSWGQGLRMSQFLISLSESESRQPNYSNTNSDSWLIITTPGDSDSNSDAEPLSPGHLTSGQGTLPSKHMWLRSGYSFRESVWNIYEMIRVLAPTKRISRYFDFVDIKSG